MTPPRTLGRKRARPASPRPRTELREAALALIRSSRAPLVAQLRRVERLYDDAWRAFCRVLAAAHTEDAASERLETSLRELARCLQERRGSREVMSMSIANSVAASRGNRRHQQLLLVWSWLGHARGRLWRLEDVLAAVAGVSPTVDERNRGCTVGEWLRVAVRALVETPAFSIDRLVGSTGGSVSERIVSYLIRIAFPAGDTRADVYNSGSGGHVETAGPSSIDMATLAREALAGLCADAHVSPGPLAIIAQATATVLRQQNPDDSLSAAVGAFLRDRVKNLLLSVASATEPVAQNSDGSTNEILSTYQSCATAPDAVQMFRQVWMEAVAAATPSGRRDPIESLAPLISSCANRDAAFRSHALAVAHDFASDAVAASDATLLRHSLELAAAATEAEDDSDRDQAEDAGYGEWFRSHFAVLDVSSSSASAASSLERSRLSISSIPPTNSFACLRAPAPTPSSGGSTTSLPAQSTCALVSTKRQLQFVCAFLLEFDRASSPRRRAHRVLAHLSAIKTHQQLSGTAVSGLLSDFCLQTRARYSKLLAEEQEASARLRRRRQSSMGSSSKTLAETVAPSASQATPAASQYPPSTRSIVENLFDLLRKDQGSFVSEVIQLKMFNQKPWKQQILPCCLDLDYWQQAATNNSWSSGSEGDLQLQRQKRTAELVRFVLVLAKHHTITTQEYTAFMDRVDAWCKSQLVVQNARPSARRKNGGHTATADLLTLRNAVSTHVRGLDSAATEVNQSVGKLTWEGVVAPFVAAFEGLVDLHSTELPAQMLAIWEAVVRECTTSSLARGVSVGRLVEQHMMLWIALLSSGSDGGASPAERMQVMESYCSLAARQLGFRSEDGDAAEQEPIELALLGSLLGLLASVAVSEPIATSYSLAVCSQLLSVDVVASTDHLVRQSQRASAFLAGVLAGFTKNPTDHAPQALLQSMLTLQMRDWLVWVTHHSRTWWSRYPAFLPSSDVEDDASSSSLWPFVARVVQAVHDRHAWFRLTFSPGVLTTKAQWQVFFQIEFTCCAAHLREAQRPIDMVEFVSVQREQIHSLLFASSAGQYAGVRTADVCIWIIQAVLELAASPSTTTSGLDALLVLLKDVIRGSHSRTSSPMSSSDVLGFLMELALHFRDRGARERRVIVQYALRCVQVVVDGTSSATGVAPHIVRSFVAFVAVTPTDELASATTPFEWICALWCLVVKLQHSEEVYASASGLPPSIFAHWAYAFPRLCRFLTPGKTGTTSHASNVTLLKAVQTCYEFFRTLDVPRLAPAPSTSAIGLSASQYVPTSAADESLLLHVRSLEWLVASGLLATPAVRPTTMSARLSDFNSVLAFHEAASRVLAALLEDLSIGRPDEVAVEVTEVCQSIWLASVGADAATSDGDASFAYQLLLVHMAAELAARHSSVGRFLLRSSSELLSDRHRGLFLLLVLITSSETELIDSILRHNGSLWVNAFAELACSLAEADGARDDEKPSPSIVAMLQPLAAFEAQLERVLARVLDFAAAQQIDLLDMAVASRMETRFPPLRDLLARVPVLNLVSEALSGW